MTNPRPWIAYVGPIRFPEGGAAARRILGNAKALAAAGYDVVIVSGQPPGVNGANFDVAPRIRCVSVNERDVENLPKPLRYMRYVFMGSRSRRWLNAQDSMPVAVVLYSGYTPYLLQLTGWARRKQLPLLFDAVEWYAASNFARFMISPYLWNTELAMRALIPNLDGVIVISRTLERYYAERGMPVLRVPPLFDPVDLTLSMPPPDAHGRVRLVYAGSPGKKDLIDIVIQAVINIDSNGGRFVLDIVGLNENEVKRLPLIISRGGLLPPCIRVHGRVCHDYAQAVVGAADFSVFLREVNRVSACGFPTKFVESMALGTPVITNLTSDLSYHLRDNETGLICEHPTRAALENALVRAFEISGTARQKMRVAARVEAERAFSSNQYASALRNFIYRWQKKNI